MKKAAWVAATLLIVGFVYWQPITQSQLIGYDDHIGVMPLEKVHSLEQYFELRNSYAIIDVLPFRDLSVWLDYRLSEVLGWRTFHLTNFMIWMLCLFGLAKILELRGVPAALVFLVVLYCGVHPVAVNSVAWVTARKHLLAAVFVIWATYYWSKAIEEEDRRSGAASVVLFFLAVLSHPIVGFWPLWAFYVQRRSGSDLSKWFLAFFGAVGVAILAINHHYYGSPDFIKVTGAEKFANESWGLMLNRVLVVGRYCFQLLIPIAPSAISYDERHWRNLIGLILLVISWFWARRKLERDSLYAWSIFCLMPIATVTIRPSNIFGMDTYILISLLGWSALIGDSLKDLVWKNKKILITGVLVVTSFTFFSRSEAALWLDEVDLWRISSQREPRTTNLLYYSNALLNKGDPQYFDQAMHAAIQARTLFPYHPHLGSPLCRSITLNPLLSNDRKEKLLEENLVQDPRYTYCWALFKASNGGEFEAEKMLEDVWVQLGDRLPMIFGEMMSLVASDWYVVCRRSGGKNCLEKFQSLKNITPPYFWKEEFVIQKLRSFNLKYPPN